MRIDVRLRVVGLDGATDEAVRPLSIFDRTPPRILAATVAPSVFAVDRAPTAIAATWRGTLDGWGPLPIAAARRGTLIRYRLSEPATVRIAFAQRSIGRRVGRACKPPTRARRRRARCIRFIPRGTLVRRGLPAGAVETPFSGRVGARRLPLGRFRATLTATDASRNRSAPRRLYFRVVLR